MRMRRNSLLPKKIPTEQRIHSFRVVSAELANWVMGELPCQVGMDSNIPKKWSSIFIHHTYSITVTRDNNMWSDLSKPVAD